MLSSSVEANLSFQDVMWKLLMHEDVGEEHVAQVVTTARALWHNRNEVRCGRVRKSGKQIFKWASDYLREYRSVVSQDSPVASMPHQGVIWAPPRGGPWTLQNQR